MSSRRLALFVLAPILIALGDVVLACANPGIPAACESLCETSSTEPCQQCLAKEKEKREEARRQRQEAARQAPAPMPAGGAGGGGMY